MSSGKNSVLKTGSSLTAFLENVIQESVKAALTQKALTEKEKQAALAPTQNNQAPQGGEQPQQQPTNNSGTPPGTVEPSKTMDDDSQKLKQGMIEPGDIVDKLNAIRSGKSFKDERISREMDEYIKSLKKAERVALYAFLKGISQIVTGEVPGQTAMEPEDTPSNVEMEKDKGKQQTMKHIEPNVIKASPPKEKAKTGQENTAGPVPITPKKR